MKSLVFGVNKVDYPSEPSRERKDGKGQTKEKPAIDLGTVAIWLNYGTKTSPPRPVFTMGLEAAMNTRKPNIEAFLKNLANTVLTGQMKVRKGDLDKRLEVLLTGIGQSAVKETASLVSLGTTTKNRPSTIAKKGFDHPGYETGLLLDNIAYEVIDE